MAKFCSWCGEPLEPGARYCAECGARVLETVKVDGKGAADPMRGLDIVAGRPIPADKTMKLDRQTLEALKLQDGLPGDAPAAEEAGATTQLHAAVAAPSVVKVPEILDLPEIQDDEAGEPSQPADDVAERGDLSEAAEPGSEASADASDEPQNGAGVEADVEEGEEAAQPGFEASDETSQDADAEPAASDADGEEPEGGPDAQADAEVGIEAETEVPEAEAELEPEPEEPEPSEPDSAELEPAADATEPATAAQPADDLPAEPAADVPLEPAADVSPAEPEEEDEAVPVIPREAQAAAAKPGPMSFDGTDTLVLPSDAQPKRFGLDRPDLAARKRKRILIALCCVIAALAIAACVLAYWRFGGQAVETGEQPQTQSAEDVATLPDESESRPVVDGPGEDGQPETLAQEQTAPTEEQILQTLTSAYAALDGYSDRIVDCVDDFNGLYMARSMDDRTAAKAKADKVKSDLEAAKAEIESLQIGQASPYATDAANIEELYDCQIGRITSLTDAWAVSVQYDIPSQHQDEILAALAANYEGGNNVYLERYDELYPYAKPVQK